MKLPAITPYLVGAFCACALAFGLGCSTSSTPADDGGLKTAVQAGPKLANAAAQAQKVELAKPAPSVPMLSDLTEVIIASTQTAGVKENELIGKLLAKTVSLKELLLISEKAREDGDAALLAAQKRIGELDAQLASANRRPLYWVAAIVGGVLIVSGAVIAAFGAQLGIAAGAVKGGVLIACGAFALGLMVVVDSILDSTQLAVAMWILVAALAIGLGYALYRWIVQGKTLAVAVAETDKMLTAVDGPAAEAFKASASRAMDFAHKEVVQLARRAGAAGREVASALSP